MAAEATHGNGWPSKGPLCGLLDTGADGAANRTATPNHRLVRLPAADLCPELPGEDLPNLWQGRPNLESRILRLSGKRLLWKAAWVPG